MSNELAEIIRRENTAFISRIGINGVAKETSHYWMEDSLNANTSATDAAGYAAGAVTINVTAGQGVRFRPGTLFRQNTAGVTEVIQVTNVATDALTVVRGYGGTTAAAIAAAVTTLQIIANPSQEGQDAPNDESKTRTRITNYCQIFQKGIFVSHTMRSVLQAGVADEFTFQISRRMLEIMRELDNAVLNSVKSATAGSDTAYRSMGGLLQFTSQAGTGNITTTVEPLTPTVINAMVKQAWDKGGAPNFILVSGKQKRAVSAFDQANRRSTFDATTAGYVVDKFVSDLGFMLDVIVDPWMPDDIVVIGDLSKIRLMPLQGDAMRMEELPKVGRAWKAQVTGQYTLEVRNANEAFAFHNNLT